MGLPGMVRGLYQMRAAVVIPALDEEAAIGRVVAELLVALAAGGYDPIVLVGDNGSKDQTAAVARAAGAVVVTAPRRGYGTACLAALSVLPRDVEVVLFADGDGADHPGDACAVLEPVRSGRADLVIGSRALGEALGLVEPGALSVPQRFGNRLATRLLRVLYGVGFTDLGPYRAVRRTVLDRLAMDDPDFGWTVQMQARAAKLRVRTAEVPVRYRRRRTGTSKVSGDVKGSALAGAIILKTVFAELVRTAEKDGPTPPRPDGADLD
jgi:glycosyltransferase involved in cell wall biosynthesis